MLTRLLMLTMMWGLQRLFVPASYIFGWHLIGSGLKIVLRIRTIFIKPYQKYVLFDQLKKNIFQDVQIKRFFWIDD